MKVSVCCANLFIGDCHVHCCLSAQTLNACIISYFSQFQWTGPWPPLSTVRIIALLERAIRGYNSVQCSRESAKSWQCRKISGSFPVLCTRKLIRFSQILLLSLSASLPTPAGLSARRPARARDVGRAHLKEARYVKYMYNPVLHVSVHTTHSAAHPMESRACDIHAVFNGSAL